MIKNKTLYDIYIQKMIPETVTDVESILATEYNQKTKRMLSIDGNPYLVMQRLSEYVLVDNQINNPYPIYLDGINDINFWFGMIVSTTFNFFTPPYDINYDFTDYDIIKVICNGKICTLDIDYVTDGTTITITEDSKVNYITKTYGNQISIMVIPNYGTPTPTMITGHFNVYGADPSIDITQLNRADLLSYLQDAGNKCYKINLNEFSVTENAEKITMPANYKKRDDFKITGVDRTISTSHYSPCDEAGLFKNIMDIIENDSTYEYLGEEFRIIIHSNTESDVTVYEGCVLENEASFSEQIDANSYSYTIPFQFKYSFEI